MKKVILIVLSILTCFCMAIGLTACGKNGIDGVNGSDGKDGVNGKSAYEIYKEKYGYEGTEEQWLDDLVNGRLALKDKYTVTFDPDGGSEVKSQEVSDGKKATEPDAPTKTGYTFGGWFVKTTEWNFLAYTVTENVTLKAKWIANEYTLKFNSNGGNEIADMTVTYDGDYILPEPTKQNYVFLGWKEGETVYEQSGKWQKASGATLTAEWDILRYTITFENAEVSPMKVAYNNSTYRLPVPTRENCTFLGWYKDGVKFEGGVLLASDITLSAKWQGITDTFEYTEENGKITLTKFKGGVTDVVIPTNINGVAVTKLADGIFRNNTGITSVTFDGSFENYDAKLFQGCFSLRSLVISGVYDKQLYYLFGDSINDIPESFAEITFAENSNYVDGTIFKNNVANHIVTHVIPDGTTEIKGEQFKEWYYMRAVSIPDSVTNIGIAAFSGCSGLTSVTIPSSVTSIGTSAFSSCSGLTSVTIPDSVTSIGNYAFYGCYRLTSVTIPDSVTSIGNYAFYCCSGLTSVTIPDGIIRIGDYTFEYCSGLTSITIPDSVTSIGSGAFTGCNNIIRKSKGICYVDKWVVGVVNKSLSTAEIEKTTKGIADSAFKDCSGLTSVTIPDSVTSIGNYAFYCCSGLTSVIIGNGVTSIGRYAFQNCSGLTSVTIGNGVTSIGSNAFNSCSGLKNIYITDLAAWCKISGLNNLMQCGSFEKNLYLNGELVTNLTIPHGVTSIGSSAFRNCSGLTSVTIPDSVTSIGNQAFEYCRGLTSVTIPDSVTSIGRYAFSSCSGLTSITIPDSVISIGSFAFGYCSGLKTVFYKGSAEQWYQISIDYSNSPLTGATRYYYSETEPSLNAAGTAYYGNYWHYDSDGKTPLIWKKETIG